MYHVHLPALHDAELIYWDQIPGTIAPGKRFDEVEPLIDLLQSHQDALPESWP